MNGYVCFFRGKRLEVQADTSYGARSEVAKRLKVKPNKQHEITVVLSEKHGVDGPKVVEHVAVD